MFGCGVLSLPYTTIGVLLCKLQAPHVPQGAEEAEGGRGRAGVRRRSLGKGEGIACLDLPPAGCGKRQPWPSAGYSVRAASDAEKAVKRGPS